MKRIIALGLTVFMCMCLGLMVPAFASEDTTTLNRIKITEDNAMEVVEAAKEGDIEAINAINQLDIVNKEKVEKKLKGIKVSYEDNYKKIIFDDGSSIEIELINEEISDNTNSIERHDVQYHTIRNSYKWTLAGTLLAQYDMVISYYYEDESDTVLLKDHYDEGSSALGFTAIVGGTTAIEDYGPRVKVRGKGGYTTIYGGSETLTFDFYGYKDVTRNSFEPL